MIEALLMLFGSGSLLISALAGVMMRDAQWRYHCENAEVMEEIWTIVFVVTMILGLALIAFGFHVMLGRPI